MLFACSGPKNQADNTQRQRGRERGAPNFAQLLAEMDANKDGKLAKTEVKGPLQREFSKVDSDGDGFITKSEFADAPKPQGKPGPGQNRR